MKHTLCPTCGHPLAVRLSVADVGLALEGRQRRMFEIIESAGRGGIPGAVIFERIYAEDRDGGPESGPKIISVMKGQLNRKLLSVGLQIVCRGRIHNLYFLETIKTGEQT